MDQYNMPLMNQLIKHSGKDPISFHVPGHKYGEVWPEEARKPFEELLKIDATELSGLDDLHAPEGVILEAHRLLSDLYGAGNSYFLVGGSTVGNLAMVLAAVTEGEIVLVQRNAHKSIFNAIKLAKAVPVFIEPEFDASAQVAGGLAPSAVMDAIKSYPAAKALIVTYPNYYGMVTNLVEIIETAHNHGLAVMVDEAHGVHFIAGSPFPPSAVSLGADIVVQSAHKTLPAMTMGAYLHYNEGRISKEKLELYLQMLQSSSPSYPIMASLDAARSYLGTLKKDELQELEGEIRSFRTQVNDIPGLTVLPQSGDPLKMVIRSSLGYSGFTLQSLLEEQGVFTELADEHNVLLVLPLLKDRKRARAFYERALERLSKVQSGNRTRTASIKPASTPGGRTASFGTLALSYREMEARETGYIPFDQAASEICAEMVIPYPPGIPLFMPGERISREALGRLQTHLSHAGKIQGGDRLGEGLIKIFT